MGLRQTTDDARGTTSLPDGEGADGLRPVDFPWAEGIRRRLAAIAEDVDPDEIPPTAAAKDALFADVRELSPLTAAHGAGARPGISSLGGGDIECTWSRDHRVLFLSISSRGERRLQAVVTDDGGMVKTLEMVQSPTPDKLRASVLWVVGHGEEV